MTAGHPTFPPCLAGAHRRSPSVPVLEMIDHEKLKAYVVRVIRIDPSVAGGRFSLFYAVPTDTAENARVIVQDSIPPDDDRGDRGDGCG